MSLVAKSEPSCVHPAERGQCRPRTLLTDYAERTGDLASNAPDRRRGSGTFRAFGWHGQRLGHSSSPVDRGDDADLQAGAPARWSDGRPGGLCARQESALTNLPVRRPRDQQLHVGPDRGLRDDPSTPGRSARPASSARDRRRQRRWPSPSTARAISTSPAAARPGPVLVGADHRVRRGPVAGGQRPRSPPRSSTGATSWPTTRTPIPPSEASGGPTWPPRSPVPAVLAARTGGPGRWFRPSGIETRPTSCSRRRARPATPPPSATTSTLRPPIRRPS